MKNVLMIGLLCAMLSSCSLFERHQGMEEGREDGQTAANEENTPPLESEVARLNTKISALETKLDVLSTSMDRMQMQKSQPIIEAQPDSAISAPQPNMAAPVDYAASAESEEQPQISAAPLPARQLPSATKNFSAPPVSAAVSSEAEKDFRAAMTLFQNGKNLESASKFAMLAKKHPQHLLASHALYWAGEAGARAQQWSLAAENWEELESRYPRSAYLPEALAGLARAYENQGDISRSRSYRDNLLRAFPKSPVALNFSNQNSTSAAAAPRATYSPAKEEAAETAPAFEEPSNNGSADSEGEQE